jgi:hypothetical protein
MSLSSSAKNYTSEKNCDSLYITIPYIKDISKKEKGDEVKDV